LRRRASRRRPSRHAGAGATAVPLRFYRRFAGVHTPIMAANAVDDRWSPPASRDAFMAGYRNAPRETLDLDPSRLGVPAIGHLGDFRAGSEALWAAALSWCDRQ